VKQRFLKIVVAMGVCLAISALAPSPARAQHGDWLMGTDGLLSGQQTPEGIFYQNLWSWYDASGSGFLQTGNLKCGPFRGRLCLRANLSASGSLNMFVDQNLVSVTTPFKILGANYGFAIDVPFAIIEASGAATAEPVLDTPRTSFSLGTFGNTGGSTKGSITNIYFQPIDLGWHFSQFDAVATGGFFAPTGPYNQNARLNVGTGHWSGVLGLGGIAYADAERTWALSIFTHVILYASQMGRNYTLGDVLPFEWAASKSFELHNDIFKELTLGPAGYAQWQISNNQINLNPTTSIGQAALSRLEDTHSQVYAAGPAIQLLTKYGLFDLRYYDEFGNKATPSGQQLMFSLALFGKPWGK
jgi:hypothetical protein